MAVIRTVSKVTSYNMDINGKELRVIVESLKFQQAYMEVGSSAEGRAIRINLITVLEGRLNHG